MPIDRNSAVILSLQLWSWWFYRSYCCLAYCLVYNSTRLNIHFQNHITIKLIVSRKMFSPFPCPARLGGPALRRLSVDARSLSAVCFYPPSLCFSVSMSWSERRCCELGHLSPLSVLWARHQAEHPTSAEALQGEAGLALSWSVLCSLYWWIPASGWCEGSVTGRQHSTRL